jgi:hypothetical protein
MSERRRLFCEPVILAPGGLVGWEDMDCSSIGGEMTQVEEPEFWWKAMMFEALPTTGSLKETV